MRHLRKILKTLDYFLVKFKLIPIIEVKYVSEKIGKFLENLRKLRNSEKELVKGWKKF